MSDEKLDQQVKAIVDRGLRLLKTSDGKGIMHMATADFTLRDDIAKFIKSRDQQIALAAQIAELYRLITPIWGDKKWDEPDDYVLNLKGHDMLNHIKELEAKATTLKQAQEEESNE